MDKCPNEFGYADLNGCPNRDAIIVPFEPAYAYLSYQTYKVPDSVVAVLKNNLNYNLRIEGHAY